MEVKEMNEILSKNRVEDVSWLCSLSESEDMLISLKLLILQRAKVIGHEELANKFDLKTLRALEDFDELWLGVAKMTNIACLVLIRINTLIETNVGEGFILMEHLKEKVKDLSLFPGSAEPLAFVAGCNLLKCDNDDILTVEKLKTCLHIDLKRIFIVEIL
ncbi:spc97/spc98 family of spindle pole body (sbp) component [Citrus sinensis]|uniref:Spc97/spc98 family of spindle pole body (Sbp) component n=1 Tax=Citrus sinensis TaxID=2711 RepID=A0ACB8N3X6_CITSI|nr:spc97/spc98 family of spindle pole body (sbp) component [Citrus sinensis]